MSFLYLPEGIPNFKSGLINLWFRPPLTSLKALADKAWDEQQAENEAGLDGDGNHRYIKPRMWQWMPLLTWGPLVGGYQVEKMQGGFTRYFQTYITWDGSGWIDPSVSPAAGFENYLGDLFKVGRSVPQRPSGLYISANWGSEGGHKTDELVTFLEFRIQMSDNGSGAWMNRRSTHTISDFYRSIGGLGAPSRAVYQPDLAACALQAEFPGGSLKNRFEFTDLTALYTKRNGPEVYQTRSFVVTPDRWHQFATAFDVSNSMVGEGRKQIDDFLDCPATDQSIQVIENDARNRITGSGTMFIMFNGANELYPDINSLVGLNKNAIVTQNIYDASSTFMDGIKHRTSQFNSFTIEDFSENVEALSVPRYQYTPSVIPSSGYPLGIPAGPNLKDDILRVELAELQIYTDINVTACDFSKQNVRDVFITDETTTGKPVSSLKAEKFLNQKALVKLHGSGKWIVGDNTGTFDDDFTTVKKIKRYRPNPSLRGPQGDSN